MLSLEVLEVALDFAHVLFDIATRNDFLTDGDGLGGVVDASQQDGDACTQGDVVESFLPVGIGLAGSFGRDGQVEGLAFLGYLNQLVHQGGLLATGLGDAAHPTEDGTQRPEEPVFLQHETRITAECSKE